MDSRIGEACYAISAVSEMTGESPATLRAWERRHGLLHPVRSEGGRRLYAPGDVQRVRRIRDCLERGVMLGQVAAVLDVDAGAVAGPTDWGQLQAQLVIAVTNFDETALDAVYGRAFALYDFAEVTESLTVPVLQTLGRRWGSGEGLVAEEHFFQTYVRNALGARFLNRPRAGQGKVLLAACVPGERHDLGLLLFCLAAEAEGFRTVNLGADTPLEELPRVAAVCRAAAIVLAANYTTIDGDSANGLRSLAQALAGPVVLVGGRQVESTRDMIESAGARVLGADIRDGIRRLRAVVA